MHTTHTSVVWEIAERSGAVPHVGCTQLLGNRQKSPFFRQMPNCFVSIHSMRSKDQKSKASLLIT